MISFEFEAHELTQQMQVMSEELGIAMPKIVKLEAYLLLKAVIKFTHPDSQAQGRLAVKMDITRAMTPLDPAKFRNEKIAQAIRQNDIPAIMQIMQQVPGWRNWQIVNFDPETLHERVRDSRGRITRFKRKFVSDNTAWKRYVSKKQKEVGSAKASWAFGYQTVGGNLPNWIVSHVGQAAGYSHVINMMGDREHPSIEVVSSAKGVAGDPEMRREIERAMETRRRAMENKTRRMLEDPLKYAKLFAAYQ